MADIKFWGSTTGSNSLSATDGFFPEGMRPSLINDSARLTMAAVRKQFQDFEWFDYGYTPTFATTASFTLAGDKRTIYQARRRVKLHDATTLYGEVTDSTFSTNTRVSVTLDSGQLAASLSAVSVGFLIPGGATPFNTATAVNSCSSASMISGTHVTAHLSGSLSMNHLDIVTITLTTTASNLFMISVYNNSEQTLEMNSSVSVDGASNYLQWIVYGATQANNTILYLRYVGLTTPTVTAYYQVKKWILS